MTDQTLGPLWVKTTFVDINGEDHLGIKNEAIIIADTLQSGITSITPRARYYSFFAWVLYEFIENSSDKSWRSFQVFLKKQEWYFILANISYERAQGKFPAQLMGSTRGIIEWEKNHTSYPVVFDYLKNAVGGYSVYRNVMKELQISQEGDWVGGIQIDRLTPTGKKLAIAFQQSVQDTLYFGDYRNLDDVKVPKDVIQEYGEKAALSRLAYSPDLSLLQNIFLSDSDATGTKLLRRNSLKYYSYIKEISRSGKLDLKSWRGFMYDSVPENYKQLPEEFKEVAVGWEIYQGRQLFTYSLETIWCFWLDKLALEKAKKRGEWIEYLLSLLEQNGVNITQTVGEALNIIPLDSNERESMIKRMNPKTINCIENIWNPLLVMFDVYRRFYERQDTSELHFKLLKSGGKDHLSIWNWFRDVERYKDKPAAELLTFIFNRYIVDQHFQVALNKLVTTGNQTYHISEDNGYLYLIKRDSPAFNTFRVEQGVSILKDLGLF